MNITIIAMAIISGPSPILASLFDLLGDGNAIPIAILSNPIITRAIELQRENWDIHLEKSINE